MTDPNPDRDPLELLAAEFMERLRRGEYPSTSEYAAQHPELAEEIRELFPTIAATERLKVRKERSGDGRATLGPAQLERLGDFRIIREIGRGGMGVVFEAEQESLGRRVAIKVLPRQALLDEKHLKRFQREARIAANLHHTNIVEVFGVGEQDGFHYYVMQCIRGVGLDAVIRRLAKSTRAAEAEPRAETDATDRSPGAESEILETTIRQLGGDAEALPAHPGLGPRYWQSVARIGLQAADALHYAHTQGTLHRDIKPANFLLDAHGVVWLTDFGLAKAAQSEDVSLSGDVVGTLRYMAPEQFRGQTDHRSDIYGLGLTLYEMLTLRPAYADTDQSRLIQRITQEPPLPPSRSNRAIPRDLETIVLKAVSQSADHRYQSAGELEDDLRSFLEDRPIRARRVSAAERLGRWCRRNKAVASLAGTTLFLLALVAIVASAGYVRTKQAWQGEARARAKAEATTKLSLEALDRIFDRFSPSRTVLRPQLTLDGAAGDTLEVPSAPVLSKEGAALLEEMLPFYDRLAQQTGPEAQLRERTAEATRRVGAIRQRLGQFDEAVQAYLRAIGIFQELNARPPAGTNFTLEIARIQNELGRLYNSRQQTAEARQAHLAALALLQPKAADAAAPPEVRFELARAWFFLGTRERPLPAMNPPAAQEEPDRRRSPGTSRPPADAASEEQRNALAQAVALLDELAKQHPAEPEYQHLLALCYLEGATPRAPRDGTGKGGADRAIEILEGLVKSFPDVPDYASDLSEACARIHIPHPPIPAEILKTTEERFRKAVALSEKLVAGHPNIPEYLASEARFHHKLGSFFRQTDRLPDAELSFRKAVELQASLAAQFPAVISYQVWLATFRNALADVLVRRNQAREARAMLDDTIALLTSLAAQHPELDTLHGLLAVSCSKLETALRQSGEKDLADAAAKKAGLELELSHRTH